MFCRNLKAHHKAEKPEWRQFFPDSGSREATLSPLKYPLAEKFPATSLMFQQLGKFCLLSLRLKTSLLRELEIVTSLLEPTSRASTRVCLSHGV
jgi:hypothetical protein